VSVLSPNFYIQWRRQSHGAHILQEPSDNAGLTEQLLQSVWHHQRLLRDQLQSLDGRAIRILHPGFLNQEAGPDFRGAVIQIGTEQFVTGDIEIDLYPHGWKGHHHDRNPAYQNVILHVVWDSERTETDRFPTLALKNILDAPLSELATWLGQEPRKHWTGQCCGPLAGLTEDRLVELLRQAATLRLQAKGSQLQARARQAGLAQSFWEGIFSALGYKNNVWPMRRLAELLPLLSSPSGTRSITEWESLLFGLAGMLPSELPRNRSRAAQYVRQLWDIWWRERDRYSESILPGALWRLSGCRPANHPERRLALAAHWIASGNLMEKLEAWIATAIPDRKLLSSLMELLQVEAAEFWSSHWTFRSGRTRHPQPLLGPQRTTDLAMNVILPWFWMQATTGKNEEIQRVVENRYFGWPRAEDNVVLRLARKRLFDGKECSFIKTAAQQQALLQIVRDFCDRSNALCHQCQFPDLVRQIEN
jgi:hypothetical protein